MIDSGLFKTYDLHDVRAALAHDIAAFIAQEEAQYLRQVTDTASAIAAQTDSCRIVWLCGPSSVGKTTTAKRLCAALEAQGVSAFVVSLDDFYRGIGKAPPLANGGFDYESPEALDLPRLHRCLQELTQTGETVLPRYDFEAGKPSETRTHLRVTGRAVVIFEGIQAFSPLLTEGIDLPHQPLRLFINTGTRFADGDDMLLCRRDIRLSRRLLRDERTRGSDFEETMAMWQTVLAGDERHIFPYSENADLFINTVIGYEPFVLSPLLLPQLPQLFGTPFEATAKRLCAVYERFEPLSSDIVPADSVLREFIGEN